MGEHQASGPTRQRAQPPVQHTNSDEQTHQSGLQHITVGRAPPPPRRAFAVRRRKRPSVCPAAVFSRELRPQRRSSPTASRQFLLRPHPRTAAQQASSCGVPPAVSRAFAGRTHEACTPTPIVTRFSLTPRPAWTISPRRYHLTAPRRSIDRRPVNRVRRTPFPPRIRNPTHPSYSTIPPLFRRPIIERPKRGFPTVTAFGDTGTAAAASRAVAAASAIAIAPSPVALPAPLPSPTPPHYSSPLRLLRRVTRKLFERR